MITGKHSLEACRGRDPTALRIIINLSSECRARLASRHSLFKCYYISAEVDLWIMDEDLSFCGGLNSGLIPALAVRLSDFGRHTVKHKAKL